VTISRRTRLALGVVALIALASIGLTTAGGSGAANSIEEAADVNGDGRVTSVDAAIILQFVAGLLSRLPPS